MMNKDIYSNEFVGELFNSIAATYDRVNALTSFGFSKRWRKKFIQSIPLKNGDAILDLMCGMGECWPYLYKRTGNSSHLTGIDLSNEMIKLSSKSLRKNSFPEGANILCEDVFVSKLGDESFDIVVSGFGLKTLSHENLEKLAELVYRVLKPGGYFTFIEMSVPKNKLVKLFYLFYLKKVMPFAGKLFLGNPENYRMLGLYTEKFIGIEFVAELFRNKGLIVQTNSYTLGCSKGISGKKQ